MPAPLSLRRHLSCCAAASLVPPHLCRLVVASPTILTCHRLSCRAGWLSPCYLSHCAAVSLFATSLIAPESLWVIDPLNPSKKRIGLLRGFSSINPTQRHGTKGLMSNRRVRPTACPVQLICRISLRHSADRHVRPSVCPVQSVCRFSIRRFSDRHTCLSACPVRSVCRSHFVSLL